MAEPTLVRRFGVKQKTHTILTIQKGKDITKVTVPTYEHAFKPEGWQIISEETYPAPPAAAAANCVCPPTATPTPPKEDTPNDTPANPRQPKNKT